MTEVERGRLPTLQTLERRVTEVERAGAKVAQTRRRLVRDMAALAAVVRTAAEQGVPDTELARQAGVSRHTIRKWRTTPAPADTGRGHGRLEGVDNE